VCAPCCLTLGTWGTREGITKWVVKKAGPAAATADTTEALAALEESEEVIILGYFKALEVGCLRRAGRLWRHRDFCGVADCCCGAG
jgi:hypothetical protein